MSPTPTMFCRKRTYVEHRLQLHQVEVAIALGRNRKYVSMAFANISLQAVENALVEARTTDDMAKKVEALTRGLESVVRHIEDQKRDNAHAVRQLKSSLGSSLYRTDRSRSGELSSDLTSRDAVSGT